LLMVVVLSGSLPSGFVTRRKVGFSITCDK
jgi:hypothetical protein